MVSESQQGVREVILCGELLRISKENVEKKYGYGHWINWLSTNFDMTRKTAAQYMLLANRYYADLQRGKLPAFQSIRQAYLIAGVVEETVKHEDNGNEAVIKQAPSTIPATLSSALLPFTRWRKQVFNKEVEAASREMLEAWLKELKEPYEAYNDIEEKLEWMK